MEALIDLAMSYALENVTADQHNSTKSLNRDTRFEANGSTERSLYHGLACGKEILQETILMICEEHSLITVNG